MTRISAVSGDDGRAAYNGRWSDQHIRITTREFRDTTGLLRSRTPMLVTRRGRVAGIFFPRPELTLPIELKRELYDMLSSDVARQLKRHKVSEDDVLKTFEASRKKRRAARRRRYRPPLSRHRRTRCPGDQARTGRAEAQKRVAASPLSKREIVRRLGTSAAQLYRLLDQTNYRKSVDQVLALLQVLNCDVDLVVRTKTA